MSEVFGAGRAQANAGGAEIALRNLAFSAIKYSDEGGQIEVETERGEGTCVTGRLPTFSGTND